MTDQFRVMGDDCKHMYCIISIDGEMFSNQEVVDKLNKQQSLINALQMEGMRKTNEIKNLRKALSKIPPKIREVWLYD